MRCCWCSMLGGVRLARRRLWRAVRRGARGKRVLIFGAGDAGEMIVPRHEDRTATTATSRSASSTTTRPRSASASTASRCSARGTDLDGHHRKHRPDEVLIAIPSADPATHPRDRARARAVQAADQDAAEAARHHRRQGRASTRSATSSVEDLLARAPVGLDPAPRAAADPRPARHGDRRRRLDRLGAVPPDRRS